MKHSPRGIVFAGTVGALYVLLTVLQNLLFPGSVAGAIQFRASEALMVLALFSPAAVYGLTVGCALSNLICGTVPIDILIGALATLITGTLLYALRKPRNRHIPSIVLLPTVINGIFVGSEIQFFYIGSFSVGSLLLQIASVMLGELAVMCALGLPLYYTILKTKLQKFMK